MAYYKYETHLHTSEISKCAKSSGVDFAVYFKNLGYTGIFVTDHFLSGNTTVCQDLPWHERVELFFHGYDVAAQKGQEVGLDVFCGWEHGDGWAHFLTYGLGKQWLLDNPDMLSWDLLHYFDRVHEDGGSVVHAHPFRRGIEIVRLIPNYVDAVEVLNGGRCDEDNRHALDYATSFGLSQVAGSDIHLINRNRLCGMEFPHRLTDARDYMAAVKSGAGRIFETRIEDVHLREHGQSEAGSLSESVSKATVNIRIDPSSAKSRAKNIF